MQELSNRRDLTFYLQELLRILEGNESNDFSYLHSIRVDKNVPSFSKSEGSAVERLWRGKSRTIEIYIPSFKSSRWNEKKNKCGRKNKLQTWKKRNLTLIFNFFHGLVPETLWVFWQSDGYNCEYMTISSAAKDMLQKLSRCNRNKIMIIYLVTRVFISLSHLHAMKIRKP